jgi:hypothetical protein
MDRPIKHMNQAALALRWNLSQRTLERWRWFGIGPQYLKIGGRVVYRTQDVEAFEAAQLRQGTNAAPSQMARPAQSARSNASC